ncbi:MAG: hypothetical protein WD381_03895 [Balneolaceae bacterium]
MKNRILHILQRVVIGTLLIGLTAHLLIPFFGNAQKTAFTQWLDQNIVASGDEEVRLRSAIRNLPEQTDDFWMLLQEASEIISNNKEDFKIAPFSKPDKDDQVSGWLIDQWSLFKYQKSGMNAVLPDALTQFQKWTTQTEGSLSAVFNNQQKNIQSYFKSTNQSFFGLIKQRIIPLIDGISINAP